MNERYNRLSSELTISTDDGDEAKLHNLPPAVMQALYHELTGRKESLKRTYFEDFIIDADAIIDLTHKIDQTLRQFSCTGVRVDYAIFHDNNERQVCSSLEKFRTYDRSRSQSVKSISIVFEFLIAVPDVGRYHSYKASITVASYSNESHDEYGNYGIYQSRERAAPIEVAIDYIDYVVARTVLQTTEDWINSLRVMGLFKINDKTDVLFEYVLRPASYISSTSLVFVLIHFTQNNILSNLYAVVFWISLLLLLQSIISSALERGYYMFAARNFFPFINMNRGDERRLEEFHKRRKRGQRVGGFLIGSCVVPVIIGLVTTLIEGALW